MRTGVLAGERFHRYTFSEGEIEASFPDLVARDVIVSPAFKRLRSINFLGAIDYLLPANGTGTSQRQSRFHHSLAVANLAQQYCDALALGVGERHHCVVAALLHDIGHAPLSHSLEPVFKSRFEIDHHVSGERIIKGDVPIGRKLARTLSHHGVNNIRVMAIIAGRDSSVLNDLFARSINVDTAEAILRSSGYLYPSDLQLTAPRVIEALIKRDLWAEGVLDAFWELKERVYDSLIQGRMGLLADFVCKRYMEVNAHSFHESYYYGTERELRAQHAELFNILRELGECQRVPASLIPPGQEIPCTKRTFYIDSSVRLTDGLSLDRRYRQRKKKIVYVFRPAGERDDFGSVGTYQPSLQLL